MEAGWCWRAAAARAEGLPAPADPTECFAPCPPMSRRGEELLDLVRVAHRQIRVAPMGGVIGLDWLVLIRMADDAGIRTDPGWYELLAAVENELVAAMNPKKDEPKEE